MTTLPIQQQTLVQRLWKVVGINVVRPWVLVLPLVIMTALFLVTGILSWLTIAFVPADGQLWFSPEFFLIILLFLTANQTIYHEYAVSLSFGISRSDFYFGSLLNFALQSIWYAVVCLSIAAVTGSFFLNEFSGVGVTNFVSLIVLFIGTQALAASTTAIYLRWGKPGMLTFFGGLALVLVALPVLAVSDLGSELPTLNSETLTMLETNVIGSAVALILITLGYLIIRKASVR